MTNILESAFFRRCAASHPRLMGLERGLRESFRGRFLLALALCACQTERVPGGPDASTGSDTGSTGLVDTSSTGLVDDSSSDGSGGGLLCGNGLVDSDEQCDEGGESATCNADCTLASCGDGVVNASAGEDCDDAGESARCDADCTPAACGDETINESANEPCDGVDLGGSTCEDLGFGGGTLACARDCQALDVSACASAPVLMLSYSPIKQFDFSWVADAAVDHYQLEQSVAPGEPFVQLGGDLTGDSASHTMPIHLRAAASYRLRACNGAGCGASASVDVTAAHVDAIGYFKSAAPEPSADYGWSVALSADGSTLAVGVRQDGADDAGGVYVYTRDAMDQWSQQAYVQASNGDAEDYFGSSVALSADGNTLAVGAYQEDSSVGGIDGVPNEASVDSGAAYVFTRGAMGQWTQQAYVKASNPGTDDSFGVEVALSASGDTLAVTASQEDGLTTVIDGDSNDDGNNAGAVYVYARDGMGTWSQQAYVKSPNTSMSQGRFGASVDLSDDGNTLAVGAILENGPGGRAYVFTRDGMGLWSLQSEVVRSNPSSNDRFGWRLDLSGDGDTLAINASDEDGSATGVDGVVDDAALSAGAVYVFTRDGMGLWSQQAYVKASNTEAEDQFGYGAVALSTDGNTLAIGTPYEDSGADGVGSFEGNSMGASGAGAVYVLVRDGMGLWSQRAYVKASNTDGSDAFGWSVALSGDGQILAVGAIGEDGAAAGIDGDQSDDSTASAGAVYVY